MVALGGLILVALLAVRSAAGGLLDCYNQDFVFEPTNWEKAVVKAETPRLYLARTWVSKKPPRLPITVVTHTQTNRDKNINQCRTWRGPLVASVYLPIVQEAGTHLGVEQQKIVEDTILELDRLHRRVESEDRCQLTMLLFWEVFTSRQDLWLYPHNSLRNLALLQVRTPFLAMVDVDLLISANLAADLLRPGKMLQLAQAIGNKKVMGFAAFEPANKTKGSMHKGRRVVASAVAGDKQRVVGMVQKGRLMRFLDDVFPPAQNVTDYERWYGATEAYSVQYAWHYEPWFIIDREANPFYDTRYRGYFFDKVLHAAHLNSTGFEFLVHPTAFIVHLPHPVSRIRHDKQIFDELHEIMRSRANVALAQMANSSYAPRTDAATERCSKVLPWLLQKEYDWKFPANWGTLE